MNTEKEHHYFASWALGWATADTRDEAVKRLVEGFRAEFKRGVAGAHKDGEIGAYIWSVKVNAAADTKYKINWFKPVGVELEDVMDHFVTYVTNKKIAYYTEENK